MLEIKNLVKKAIPKTELLPEDRNSRTNREARIKDCFRQIAILDAEFPASIAPEKNRANKKTLIKAILRYDEKRADTARYENLSDGNKYFDLSKFENSCVGELSYTF